MFSTPTRLAFRYRPVFDGLWTPFFIFYSNRFRIAQIRSEDSFFRFLREIPVFYQHFKHYHHFCRVNIQISGYVCDA